MPYISVVMPVYNGASYIEETLDSMLAQSFHDFEVICVNDSSTDDSYGILERYASTDSRIKVFTKPNEGLASKAVKFGLEKASGTYYMYSSQDDLYSSDLLEKGATAARATNADAVIPDLVCYRGNINDKSFGTFWRRTIPDPEHLTGKKAFELSLDWRIHGFGLYRTELVRRIGIDTSNYNSDEFTTRKLLLNCNKIAFSDGIFYYRIDNPHAITKKMSLKLFDVFETNRKLEMLAVREKVSSSTIVRLRELALNDVAIRQKLLYMKGRELTPQEQKEASRKTKEAYRAIHGKHELFRNGDILRRILFTHGFGLLKTSMKFRALLSK